MSAINRLGSANTYDNALRNMAQRQSTLSTLQEQLTSGKKIVRPSDDPTGAAQAERALVRIQRIQTEQRALDLQQNSIRMAESTLGDAVTALQRFRDLTVAMGNASYSDKERASAAQELGGLREQLLSYANRTDTNGMPLFGGMGSAAQPFRQTVPGDPALSPAVTKVVFDGIGGQAAASESSIPGVLDGEAAWMNVYSGNGTYEVQLGGANTGKLWASQGTVTDPTHPSVVNGDTYQISFTKDPVTAKTQVNVANTTAGLPGVAVITAQNYVDGAEISFEGRSVQLHGAPTPDDPAAVPPTVSDVVNIVPSAAGSIFDVTERIELDMAGKPSGNKLTHSVTRSLGEIDAALEKLIRAQASAGNLLTRAETIGNVQGNRAVQLEADRSRAEDLDMIKGISDFQNQQNGYDVALKSYAQIQRLNLFNYVG